MTIIKTSHLKFFIDGEAVPATKYHKAIYDELSHEFVIVADGNPETIVINAVTSTKSNNKTS